MQFDTLVMHPARRYNYLLGGKDNFAADRESAEALLTLFPNARDAARENRKFMERAVAWLADACGVQQYIDIGPGLPMEPNTHDIVERYVPKSTTVYVDNDSLVCAHARALMAGSGETATSVVEADLCKADDILAAPAVQALCQSGKRVALLLVAVLHFLPDSEAQPAMRRLIEALPSGSYVVISHATAELVPAHALVRLRELGDRETHGDLYLRSLKDVLSFVEGLQVQPPGVVPVTMWRHADDPKPTVPASEAPGWALVAKVP